MSNQNLKNQTADTQDKSYRIVAILIALASVVAFFLPLKVWINGAVENKALFGILATMSKSSYKMYGVLPILGNSASAFNRLSSYVVYVSFLALLVALVVSVAGIILSKKSACLSKVATYVFTWGVALYSIAITVITSYVSSTAVKVDVSTVVLAVIGALIYFFLMYKEHNHKAWVGAAQFVLSLAAFIMVALAITHHGETVSTALNKNMAFKTYLALCIFAFIVVLAVNTLSVFCKKYAQISLVSALAQAIIVLVVVIVAQVAKIDNKQYAVYSLIAAIISFVQILLACLLMLKANKKEARAELDAFIKEVAKDEYVEVYPYDGSPVAGIYVAEVVEENNAPAEQAAPVADAAPAEAPAAEEAAATDAAPAEAPAPAPFDAFIASLNDEERNQFTDLYILKTVNMPEIPEYKVGGNNKAFFNKVFIYLGQYRDKIPSDLLAKMYDFSMKI